MVVPEITGPLPAPLAIGGVGGSGTRLIARLLLELGWYLGEDLNGAHDNLWFTLLFKRAEILDLPDAGFAALTDLFARRMTGASALAEGQAALIRSLASTDRSQHPAAWLQMRADSFLTTPGGAAPGQPWGWKEPNTHLVIDRLRRCLPRLRYLHVVRNGLDMAYSRNQNQLALWGPRVLDDPAAPYSPRRSLQYWRWVQERILGLGAAMGTDFLWLDYDHFCAKPTVGLERLLAFLGTAVDEPTRQRLLDLVQPPTSLGRFKAGGLDVFNPADVAYARRLGFDTTPD